MELFNNSLSPASHASLNLSTKSAILLQLVRYVENPDNAEQGEEAAAYIELIDREVIDIKASYYGRTRYNIKLEVSLTDNSNETVNRVATSLKSVLVVQIIRNILGLPLDKNVKIEVIARPNKGTFRISGHYIDQKLKQTQESDIERLFDTLSPQVRDNVQDIKVLVQGIRLDPFEDRVLNAIIRLLNLKSDKDLNGNLPAVQGLYGGTMTAYPKLLVTPHELYSEVSDNDKEYSGKEIQNIKAVLMRLQEKKFLIMYQRHRKETRNGKTIEVVDVIQEYQSLLRIISYYEGLTKTDLSELYNEDNTIPNKKGKAIFLLNPVFVDQIDTKFIEYPEDINRQSSIAAGGANKLTSAMTQLRDYIMRIISANKSNKKSVYIIDRTTLIDILGLSEIAKQGRAKRVNDRIEEAFKFCLELKLITNHKEITGKKGQRQMEFHINFNTPNVAPTTNIL